MLDTDDRVALSSFGCYSRQDGSCTRVSRKSPAIWFLEAVCKRQQGGVRKSQASADLSLRFLRLTEDGGRISPVQVICSQRSGAISIGALDKQASVKTCDLRIKLIIHKDAWLFCPSGVSSCRLTAEPARKHDSCHVGTNLGLSGCHTR